MPKGFSFAREWASRTQQFLGARRGSLYFDLNQDYRNSILLAGSGRGGTTWLAEIINYHNGYRDIFEPFNSLKVPAWRNAHTRQYLRPTEDNAEFLSGAALILSGRVRGDWTDRYNRRIFCERRLIKEIRANLFLKWIKVHFPNISLIFILRHPFAVVASRLHLKWRDDFGTLLSQPSLIHDYLRPFVNSLLTVTDSFQRHMYLWCVENYVPLKQLRHSDAHVVFYEDLCRQPEKEIVRLSSFLRTDFGPSVRDRFKKPSTQTRRRTSAIAVGKDPVTAWMQHVSPEQMEQGVAILDQFGLARIYDSEPLPHVTADEVLRSDEPVATSS